jgi:hypothetical protein
MGEPFVFPYKLVSKIKGILARSGSTQTRTSYTEGILVRQLRTLMPSDATYLLAATALFQLTLVTSLINVSLEKNIHLLPLIAGRVS